MEKCDFESASSLTWFGVVDPCTERCDVEFLFVFIWVVDCKTTYETSYAAVLMPCIQGWSCRRVARCVGLLTDGMAVLFVASVTNL